VGCRVKAPGQNIREGWKEAFGDQEFAEMALVDPLIVWEPARLGAMVSVLGATTDNWRHLENITAPFLVSVLCSLPVIQRAPCLV
jgi:hypothetical protein